eukprot:GHRQ01007594.1.p1 GENE.GHRQ01007594.1~~GHRQ01007594.1.p1  ORF type:complete len:177 (+),score=30.92 GHRQ01007594.1:201-731(+)
MARMLQHHSQAVSSAANRRSCVSLDVDRHVQWGSSRSCPTHRCSINRSERAAASLLNSSAAWTSTAAAQHRRWRCAAAAPEVSLVLQEPEVEFLGVMNDGMQTVRGVMHVAAEADLVYKILTDYDSCSRVFRNIAETQTLLTPEGGKQVVQVRCLQGGVGQRLLRCCKLVRHPVQM